MESDSVVADLHMHTPASDGTIGIDQRATVAGERGLDAIAITDHDVVDDQLTAPSERIDGVAVIAGVEIRADLFETKIEILGYYVDPTDVGLREMLETARGFREQRNRQLVENLAAETGLTLSYERLVASVDGNLGRPHLAERLVDEGIVSSTGAAFDQYLAEGGSAFVPMERLNYEEVVETIHGAGGITALAHPGRIRADTETVPEMLDALVEAGLDGIEVWYPYGRETSSTYADISVEDAAELADEFDLLRTGGSDCHGPGTGKFRLGECGVGRDAFDSLTARVSARHNR